ETYPRDFGVLLTGIKGEPEDDPDAVLNFPGTAGNQGVAVGTGIYGSANLQKTTGSDNEAFERQRPRDVGPRRNPDGSYTLGGFASFHEREQVSERDRADVAGGTYQSDGMNFIGAVDSGFANDRKGTTANPLSAKPANQTGLN